MRPRILTAALLALVLSTSSAWAYTIFLKDGTKLIARDKYRVQNGLALIVLQNGTHTSIQLSEIDEARTTQANQTNYGTAVVLDESGKETVTPSAPPPRRPELKDLIAARQSAPAPTPAPPAPSARRPAQTASPAAAPSNATGLAAVQRAPLPRLELAAEIRQALRAKGIEDVTVYRGSRPDRALLEITTNSEAAVFRALEACAAALLQVRARGIGTFEVAMATAGRERAGEFVLTPDLANVLALKQMETSAFFVQYVQF